MEAARMCFGPKTLPHLCNGAHLYIPTKLSLFLHNKVSLSRRATKHKLLLCGYDRPLTHFAPSLWRDHFLSAPLDYSERICLIHLLVNLGTSHYFEKEIEEIIDQAFLNLDSLFEEENSLEITAIMFVVTDQMHSWARCSTRARPDARAGGQTLN
ncbi:LOW QUALITY PROTEIN: hypothetical protein YC2023_015215 [Brassica napus]